MKKNIFIPVIVIVLITLVLFSTSCTKNQEKETEVIKIGAILPLTGGLAWFGEHAQNAALLLEEELNLNKEVVDIISYDSKSTPKDGLTAYRKMVFNGLRTAYVSLDPVAKTIIPNIKNDEVIIFAGSVDNDISSEDENIFRLYYGFKNQSDAQYNLLLSKHVEKISMMLRNVSHAKKYSEDYLGNNLKKSGINIQNVEMFEGTEKDFRNIITKISSVPIDALVMMEYGNLYPEIFLQMHELNLNPPLILCGLGMMNVQKTDYELYEGVIFTAPAFLDDNNSNFANDYKQKFGVPPTYEAYYAYDSFKTIYLAIKNTNKTTDEVKNYILNNSFKGVSQPEIIFDKSGDMHVSVILKQLKDAQITNLK